MKLPPPFENETRNPDFRAFVKVKNVEFTFFICEDSNQVSTLHKDTHKIVQEMRCALRTQTRHWNDTSAGHLACFGMLNSTYKIQLLIMWVDLYKAQDYENPTFMLHAENPIEVQEKNGKIVTQDVEKLLSWLSAVRSYGSYLRHKLVNEQQTISSVGTGFPTSTKIHSYIAKTSATCSSSKLLDNNMPSPHRKNDSSSDDNDGDKPQHQSQSEWLRRRDIGVGPHIPNKTPTKFSKGGASEVKDTITEQEINALFHAIEHRKFVKVLVEVMKTKLSRVDADELSAGQEEIEENLSN